MNEFNLYDNNDCNDKINEKNQNNNNFNGNQIDLMEIIILWLVII